MLAFLEQIREKHTTNDDILIALGEIENEITSKKYGLLWEEHEEAVDVAMRENIPVFTEDTAREIITGEHPFNFILEGDNLHSLYLLEKTCRERVDCIYIDPPYNTGAKDWKYNNDYVDKTNAYRHSKWLSMMNARLRIAKNLLKDDGVLIVAIDENELGTTLLLLDDIFGQAYAIDPITVVHNPRGVQGDNFSYVNNSDRIKKQPPAGGCFCFLFSASLKECKHIPYRFYVIGVAGTFKANSALIVHLLKRLYAFVYKRLFLLGRNCTFFKSRDMAVYKVALVFFNVGNVLSVFVHVIEIGEHKEVVAIYVLNVVIYVFKGVNDVTYRAAKPLDSYSLTVFFRGVGKDFSDLKKLLPRFFHGKALGNYFSGA